jgi:glycosyltransferase involved in cell wall biosynthesis
MIALCMISEGDHPNLKRAVKSVYKYVDKIYITTTKINKPQWEDPKIEWSYFPWCDDFSAARNFNLSKVSPRHQFVLWIDSDDVVQNPEAIPAVVGQMIEKGIDAVFVDYNYDIDADGNVLIVHPRERITRNGIYHWKGKLHETFIPNRRVNNVFIKDFAINHYPTKENKEDGLLRNLRVLQKDYEDQRKRMVKGEIDEIDPRTEYYLGRCLFDTHTEVGYKRAFNLFQDYIQHSGWDEERAFAWNYMGNILYQQKNYKDSLNCYLSAISERPEFPTWHINLARSYAALKDFGKAEHHIKVAINMEQPKTAQILTPLEDRINSLIVMFYVFFDKKDFKQCLQAANMLYDLKPTEENAKRIESITKIQTWTEWMKSVTGMVKDLYDKNQMDKINQILEGLPDDVKDTAYTDTLRLNYAKAKIWPAKSIAYYAAIDLHEWSPDSLKTGLGGSEEAIVYLSKEWAKLGYDVTVYTNVGAKEGDYDGVHYLNYQRFNAKDRFDILVSWRNPHFIHKNVLDARLILLDLHDIPEVGEYDAELLSRVDYIMVKSQYHRQLLPQVPDNKFVIVNNGIDWDLLKQVKGKKDPHAVFYGSSPDRGLDNLLDVWGEIRKAVPDATLHVCYGFDLYDKIYSHVKSKMAWRNQMMELLKQPGITYHGKVGKEELYKIAHSCGVWAYPTYFQEIDCITARYCQALGTVPLVHNYAALETTVQRGVRLAVDPDKYKLAKKFTQELIKVLNNPNDYQFDPAFAKQWSWANVAKSWSDVFNLPKGQETKLTVFTPTIRSGFWNLMAENLSRQTYKNFEWLIVDDYPEDRKAIADKYAKKYGLSIRYLRGKKQRSQYNYSLIQADNQAIYNATGDLIVWLQDFILLPPFGLERLAEVHRRYPNSLIAPVDQYNRMSVKPDLDSKEDWFHGETKVIGQFLRKNIRIKQEDLHYSYNPYDFEMNIGAIPTKIARKLNGLWEFQDDGLGYNNTEIAFRALKIGHPILVDERLRAVCLDLWEYLAGHEENAKDREWNLNDARYDFIVNMTNHGKLPIVRNSNLDRKIKLDNQMPKGLTQDGAAKWIQKNATRLAKKWEAEWGK